MNFLREMGLFACIAGATVAFLSIFGFLLYVATERDPLFLLGAAACLLVASVLVAVASELQN